MELNDIHQIFENKKHFIVVDTFLSSARILRFLQELKKCPEWNSQQSKVFENHETHQHLFYSQYMHLAQGDDEDSYLQKCVDYQKIWHNLTQNCQFDPFLLFIQYLQEKYNIPLKILEKNGKKYSPIIVRNLNDEVYPHADFGAFDGPGWAVDKVVQQIAWNIYFECANSGNEGQTTLYNLVWEKDHKVETGSYQVSVSNQNMSAQFIPKPGQLILFNSRNVHSVKKTTGNRISIGGFIGRTADNQYVAWG